MSDTLTVVVSTSAVLMVGVLILRAERAHHLMARSGGEAVSTSRRLVAPVAFILLLVGYVLILSDVLTG